MKERWPNNLDALYLGALAGFFGAIVKAVLEQIAVVFMPSYRTCIRLAAAVVMPPERALSGVLSYIVGLEVDLVVSMVAGVVAVLILSAWGTDRYPVKGVIGGALLWVLLYAFLSGPVSSLEPSTSFSEVETSLFIHIIFGLIVVWSAVAIDARAAGRNIR